MTKALLRAMGNDTAIADLTSAVITMGLRVDDLESLIGDFNNWTIERFVSLSERAASLAINGAYQSVYSVYIPSCAAGDLLLFQGNFEVTNDNAYTVGIFRKIVRTTTVSDIGGTTIFPSGANMDNVNLDLHHKAVSMGASEVLSFGGDLYYNLVIGAASTGGSGTISIEPGYGGIAAIRFRKAA